MARIRTVKPAYHQNRKARAVSRDARLLNIGMWNIADDEGRLQELSNSIIGAVFPTDEDVTPGTLREWLQELSDAGLIVRYEVDGERYIQIHDWHDHQRIDKPQPSVLPALEEGFEVIPDDSKNDPGMVPEEVPDRSQGEGKGMEGNKEGKGMESSSLTELDAPLSFLLAGLIEGNGAKRPRVDKGWADAERLMFERDGRDRNEAERLIRWCQNDDFWRANILSMPKFRKQYDQLLLQAKRSGRSTPALSPAERRANEIREKREARAA